MDERYAIALLSAIDGICQSQIGHASTKGQPDASFEICCALKSIWGSCLPIVGIADLTEMYFSMKPPRFPQLVGLLHVMYKGVPWLGKKSLTSKHDHAIHVVSLEFARDRVKFRKQE